MKRAIGPNSSAGSSSGNAFTLTELLAVLCAIAVMVVIVLPVLAKDTDSSERAICLSNMRHIMAAVAMYSTDNNDFLPHPSWGSDLSGPSNWCYATRLPTGQSAPSAAGKGGPNAHTNQLPFYLAGQLARYLESQRVLVCPTDWRDSMSTKSFLYVQRPLKLTSYTMNATVGGYVGPKAGRIPNGTTYKTTDFLPTNILLWEQNDTDAFYFNDAASNPEVVGEGLSRRHVAANGEGFGAVGRAGGSVDFIKWRTFNGFLTIPRPNDLLCGPGYQ